MKEQIYCKVTDKGLHSFFLVAGGKKYFLFNQNYRRGVHNYFKDGVMFNQSLKKTNAHGDHALMKTISKIPMYIKYIEKEYDVAILEKTKIKNRKRRVVKPWKEYGGVLY